MRILIIGGTGFIGPYVVDQLCRAGHELAIFNRGHQKAKIVHPGVAFIIGDRKDLYDNRQNFKQFQPEVVIDMGAYTKNDAETAIRTFDGITSRIVVLSSMDVYHAYGILIGLEDGNAPTPLNEESELRYKKFPFGGDYEKILVEELFMNCGTISGTILRLPMTHGPGDPFNRLYKYAKRINDRRPFIILDDVFAAWHAPRGYVENVAHAICLAAVDQRASHRIYNVGDKEVLSETDWLNRIGTVMSWEGQIYTVARDQLPDELIYSALNLRQQLIPNTSRIREELGYQEIVPMDEGIMRTIRWELQNPPEKLHPNEFPRLDYEDEDKYMADRVG